MLDQETQPEMLFRKRVDVLVLEKQIFYSLLAKSNWADAKDKVKVHAIFPTNPYAMAFKDRQLIPLFNQALEQYLRSEDYKALREKYSFID